MITLNVKLTGADKVAAFLGNYSKQLPFAISNAINDIAGQVQTQEKANIRSKFTIRNNWLDKSPIAVKRTWSKKTTLTAMVYSDAKFLPRHEEGTTKIPYGRYLAIPTSNVKRGPRGAVPARQKPAALKRSFVVTTRQGQPILLQRTGKGPASTTKAMYMLETRAKTRPVLQWYAIGGREIDKRWRVAFDKALDNALRTAK